MTEYQNNATQEEKLEALRNDTNFSRQQNELAESGGRYSKVTPSKLVGADQAYPAPPTGPWSGADPAPLEPPLGFSVDAMQKD